MVDSSVFCGVAANFSGIRCKVFALCGNLYVRGHIGGKEMRTEDGYIIQECLDGESEAFGVLVDKYKEGIYAFVYAKLRDFHDAQDVTQEVFLHAYRNLRTLRRWESFASWLYRIASRRCKLWIRSASRRIDREFIQDQDPKVLMSHSMDSYRDNQLGDSLQECMDSLSETYREVLTLHYFAGMTIREMSIALGASPTAIGVRLSRARAQLREEMVAMMDVAFEGQRLPSGFTFRIVESVKRIDIRPMPRMAGLPWGLALATGIILAILSIGSHLNLPDLFSPASPAQTYEAEMAEIGEMPVEMLRIPQIPISLGKRGDSYGSGFQLPEQQNSVLMAPRDEGYTFPEEPAARLGKGTIECIVYSPDGKLLAVSGGIGVWLYDADNLNEVGLLQGHTSTVTGITFSPDGKTLASGSYDNTVRLWDIPEQKQVGLLEGHAAFLTSVAFSPDGKILASGGADETVRLWDVQRQEQMGVLQGHIGRVGDVAFSPDGKILASTGLDEMVHLWDVVGQKQVGVLETHAYAHFVAFSPDGKTLASGGGWTDRTVLLWDVAGQKQVGVLQGGEANSVAFSPDGKILASGGGGKTVCLWDVNERKQVGVLQGHTGSVYSVAFSQDGKTLVSASSDNTIRQWDVQEQEQIGLLEGYTSAATSVAFSPDGRMLASGSYDRTVRLWDIHRQEQTGLLQGHTDRVRSIAFSSDGKTLASGGGDKTVRLWDVNEQKQVGVLQEDNSVWSVAFSLDGKTLASGGDDKVIHLWDVERQEQITSLQGHTGRVRSIAFSPDGKLLASGSRDELTVRLWDINEQKQVGVLRGHGDIVYSVVFSPDGELLASGSWDRTVRLWSVPDKTQMGVLRGHTEWVNSVAFSPDGKLLASGGGDKAIRLWDVDKRKEVAALRGHRGEIYSVAFSSDGRWLVSGSYDGTVLLWEVNLPGISVEPMGKLPSTWGKVKRTALLQNFPNPFNPETWIPYQLAEDVDVKIRIYDGAGHLIRTLNPGRKPSGFYTNKEKAAYWDGKNESGEPVSSGVYFYTIRADDFTATKKMVVAQ